MISSVHFNEDAVIAKKINRLLGSKPSYWLSIRRFHDFHAIGSSCHCTKKWIYLSLQIEQICSKFGAPMLLCICTTRNILQRSKNNLCYHFTSCIKLGNKCIWCHSTFNVDLWFYTIEWIWPNHNPETIFAITLRAVNT